MKVFKLIFKNALRHKLRTILTVLGIAIAVIAFGILRTVVTSWSAGVEASASNRLIARQAISFIFLYLIHTGQKSQPFLELKK